MSESDITIDDINKIDDSDGAFELAEKLDVDMEGLDTVEEMKERLIMKLNKNEYGNPKILIAKSLMIMKKEDEHKRGRMVRIVQDFQKIMTKERLSSAVQGERNADTKVVEELLKTEGTSSNLREELQGLIHTLEQKEVLFVVAGETSAGKSSVLNLLLEADVLPFRHGSATSVITRISYGKKVHVTIYFKDVNVEAKVYSGVDIQFIQQEMWPLMAVDDEKLRQYCSNIKEIHIQLPLDILQCGLVLIDSPGIGENEAMDEVIAKFVENNTIMGFIYVIKSDNSGGVDEDRLLRLLKVVLDKQKRLKSDASMKSFDSKSAIFLCNKWDLIKEDKDDGVYRNAVMKLSQCWPQLEETQVMKLETLKAQEALKVDQDFVLELYRTFLERLRDMYINAVNNRLQQSYRWLKNVIKRSVFHFRTLVAQVDLSEKDMQLKMSGIRQKLDALKSKSEIVLRTLHGEVDAALNEICQEFRTYLQTPYCRSFMNSWTEFELPEIGESGWSGVKFSLTLRLGEKLVRLIEEWEGQEQKLPRVENRVLDLIKTELNLLQDEMETIESDMDDSSKNDQDQLRKSVGCLVFGRRRAESHFDLNGSSNNPLPIKLLSRVVNPVQNILTSMRKVTLIDNLIQNKRLNAYKEHPQKIAKSRSEKFMQVLLQPHKDDDLLYSIFSGLMERSRLQLDNIEKSIPALIESNEQLLQYAVDCRSNALASQGIYREVNRESQAVERTLKHFYQGYVSVESIRILTYTNNHQLKISKIGGSNSFRVTDILRLTTSIKSSKEKKDDGIYSALFTSLMHVNQGIFKFTVKCYLPSAGLDTTYMEVARLRFASYKSLAIFKGIHYADAPPPVYVFADHLMTVRQRFHEQPDRAKEETPGILRDTVDGLSYIHRHKLVHMELCQNTVTVNSSGQVKLTGSCLPRAITLPCHQEQMHAGDFVYLPPDVLKGKTYVESSDIYSFGLFLYELIVSTQAYIEHRRKPLRKFISTVEPLPMIEAEDNLNSLNKSQTDLIRRCLDVNCHNYPTIDKIKEQILKVENITRPISWNNNRVKKDSSLRDVKYVNVSNTRL